MTVCNKQIEIKAGMDQNDNFTFKGEGHQQPGRPNSNLFINFVQAPGHSEDENRYSRKARDLFYRKRVTL